MKVLLHICCGPCAIFCVNSLREKGHSVSGFFYNPNIHPLAEYDRRKEAIVLMAQKLALAVYFHREYEFEDFFKNVTHDEQNKKCQLCWQLRLKTTAGFAKEKKYDVFTTTLLISPYQNHERIKDIAASLEKDYGINFYYEDFRPGFRESHNLSKQMGLYHQKYCGCIYSERERLCSEKH